MTLLISHKKGAIRIAAHSIGCPESMSEHLAARSIGRYHYQSAMVRNELGAGMPRTLGVIEISLLIRLQAHGKFMEMLRHLMV